MNPVLSDLDAERTVVGAMLVDERAIGKVADVVLFIHRQDSTAELIVAQQCHGPTGSVNLRWNPRMVRFEDLV